MTDWFQALCGFRELPYADTQRQFEVDERRLHSRANGRSWNIGIFETPSLGELRTRAASVAAAFRGPLHVSIVVGDVGQLHRDPVNRCALFQVASQFNLLEMTGPDITPEHGVTRYAMDRTQGPVCAIAAGAATIYRNYLVPVRGRAGQTSKRQIDCLRDVGEALGNLNGSLWTMRNGYALCTEPGLASIDGQLKAMDDDARRRVCDRLRVGLHLDTEVTTASPGQVVSQVFCSALPVAYCPFSARRWARFATLVLEAAYEATLWAAVLNAERTGVRTVFVTLLGGGAFGNDARWIQRALRRALVIFRDIALDVRIVSYSQPNDATILG